MATDENLSSSETKIILASVLRNVLIFAKETICKYACNTIYKQQLVIVSVYMSFIQAVFDSHILLFRPVASFDSGGVLRWKKSKIPNNFM